MKALKVPPSAGPVPGPGPDPDSGPHTFVDLVVAVVRVLERLKIQWDIADPKSISQCPEQFQRLIQIF